MVKAEMPLAACPHPENHVRNEMTRGRKRQGNEPQIKRGAEGEKEKEAETGQPENRVGLANADHGAPRCCNMPQTAHPVSIDRAAYRRYDGWLCATSTD